MEGGDCINFILKMETLGPWEERCKGGGCPAGVRGVWNFSSSLYSIHVQEALMGLALPLCFPWYAGSEASLVRHEQLVE